MCAFWLQPPQSLNETVKPFSIYEGLATISLTFILPKPGNSKDTSQAANTWNSPSQQNLETQEWLLKERVLGEYQGNGFIPKDQTLFKIQFMANYRNHIFLPV